MVLFHKDFSKEALETKDFWRISGIDDETAKSGTVEPITDKKIIMLNRARAKAMLLAEEMNAEITVEQENDEFRIIISKKKRNPWNTYSTDFFIT